MSRTAVGPLSGLAGALLALGNVHVAASDIVICRVGDGAAALSSAATAVFLERRAPDGSLVAGPIALPTVASGSNQPFTLGGSNTSEGALTVSTDGGYLTLAGYAANTGTASVSATTSATVNRVVARIDALGTIDTSSRLNSAFSTSNVRAAVSTDGTGFWVSGSGIATTGGIWFLVLGTTGGTQVLNTPANARTVDIFSGGLYGASGSSGFTNVFSVGSGLPTTAGQIATPLPGMPASGSSLYAFALFDRTSAVAGIDTLYVADDRAIASGGGIQKWTFDGVTWSLSNTFTNGLTAGVRGLAAEAVGAHIVLYATTTDVASNLIRLIDDGTPTPAANIIATAPANTTYRGVALAWTAPVVDVIFKDGFN